MEPCGILLCGGASTRFGANKLLVDVSTVGEVSARAMCAMSARKLRQAVPRVVAVIRPGDAALRSKLEEAGCEIVETPAALRGIGASLAAGVAASADASGWIVALGDMPFIRAETIAAVASRLGSGAVIAAPVQRSSGERGHPVAFSSQLRDEILALDGDEGARSILSRHAARFVPVPVEDPGIVVDIDTPDELARHRLAT